MVAAVEALYPRNLSDGFPDMGSVLKLRIFATSSPISVPASTSLPRSLIPFPGREVFSQGDDDEKINGRIHLEPPASSRRSTGWLWARFALSGALSDHRGMKRPGASSRLRRSGEVVRHQATEPPKRRRRDRSSVGMTRRGDGRGFGMA